ncbi:MAG: hypothetical protein E7129_03885 [Rikenellaceae bacterium]|nr:hypothetical protein [Rikenellaceae bacterium]
MWRKLLRILGFLIGWGVILAYILYASHLAQEHHAEQRVEEVVVSISDSTATQLFATSEQIHRQLQRGGFRIENKMADSVDAVKISDYIARNGFVRDVDAYVTYSGKLYVDVKQHEPIVRLLCGGENSYITPEGVVFRSPQGSAYYTAVVTGTYRPIFVRNYEGDISSRYASMLAKEEDKLTELGRAFAEVKSERSACLSRRSELRKKSKQGVFESKENHQQRKVGIGAELAKCDDKLKQLAGRKASLEKRKQGVEKRKKKLEKKYDDFLNLINFVTKVEEDSFWSAEVVQFIADTTSMGEINMRLVPRSGDFVIEFGTLADSDEKLKKLQTFYDDGLAHMGWNQYKIVDVRYNKQVICTE